MEDKVKGGEWGGIGKVNRGGGGEDGQVLKG